MQLETCQSEPAIWGSLWNRGIKEDVCAGYNTTELRENSMHDQCGGTAIAIIDCMAVHVADQGLNYTKLGRWLSQLIGKSNVKASVVVAYQPCEKGKASKGFTVFEQHERYFEAKGDF